MMGMSALMFFIYSQLAAGLNGYVTQMVAALTNVEAIGKDTQSPREESNVGSAIANQIKGVTTDQVAAAGSSIAKDIKRKATGDYSAGAKPAATSKHYRNKAKAPTEE